jgi:erythromycin esterase
VNEKIRINKVLIGFGTYKGNVIVSKRWSEKMEQWKYVLLLDESWDKVLHNLQRETLAASAINNKLIIISYESDNNIFENKTNNNTWRGQSAIGVVYNPQYEKYGNYVLLIYIQDMMLFYLLMKPMHYIIYI